MKVVTYSRVSSLGQETEGESLVNQERGFLRALAERGWTRLAAYAETASAKTAAGRVVFGRMLEELDLLRPDAIVVDTLDRFTRHAAEGLALLEALRGRGVGLIPLDWRRDRPIDLDDDRDWRDVYDEFGRAEWERRRIASRVRRSYEERRTRGESTANRPPFGVLRVNRQLVPDPECADLVRELDALVLAGVPLESVHRYAKSAHERAWRTPAGYRASLVNEQYVRAGVRTAETAAAIRDLRADSSRQHPKVRVHVHEFSGVFACGRCVDAGYPEAASLMYGVFQRPKPAFRLLGAHGLRCNKRFAADRRHGRFMVRVSRVEDAWHAFLRLLGDDGFVEAWAAAADRGDDTRRRLQRSLARIDGQAAALKERRDAALDLYRSVGAVARAQVEQSLREVGADEAALAADRQAVLGELARTEKPQRDPERLRAVLADLPRFYTRIPAGERNRVNRAIVAAIGSRPVVRREGRSRWDDVEVTWPALTEVRVARESRTAPRPAKDGRRR